jgi:hypothetical protein
MVKASSKIERNPRSLCQVYFSLAKRRARYAFLCKFLVFVVGILAVFIPNFASITPLFVLVLAIAAEFLSWRSDTHKGKAEAWLRKLDGLDSFGWQISKAELSDLLVQSPIKIDNLVMEEALKQAYFASQETQGTQRALENLQESAWWSKHLTERMWQYYTVATALLFILALIILLTSISIFDNTQILSSVGRIITSTLTLIVSLNLARSILNYYSFSLRAGRIEATADILLKSPTLHESEVIKLWNEYHLARSSAPIIPTWLWNQMRDRLNETWKQCRQ